MTPSMIAQTAVAFTCLLVLIAWLAVKRGTWNAKGTLRQLILWYPLSAPWLLVRTPLLYVLTDWCGLALWSAVIVEFIIERPLFFLTAREISSNVK